MNEEQTIQLIEYINSNKLVLGTAESCTAGAIMSTLANQGNCGDCLFMGYIVYSSEAKKKYLGVQESTIKKYTLTSEPVAREMASGVFHLNEVNVAIATTGITGNESMDGIPPGTICFAWGFKNNKHITLYSDTRLFKGDIEERCQNAVYFALSKLQEHHRHFKKS